MSKKIKDLAQISLVACLYVIFTLISSSISYLPSQFRVGEMVKPISTFDKKFAVSMMIGNFLSNLFSPFAGPMELVFMPLSNLIGCRMGFFIGKYTNRFIGSLFIAFWISASVAFTLKIAADFPFFETFMSVLVSEAILMVTGYFIMEFMYKRGVLKING